MIEWNTNSFMMFMVLAAFMFLLNAEVNEFKGCPVYKISNDKCSPSTSIFNREMIPSEKDTTDELKTKILKAAVIESKTVKWRVSLIIAIASTFLLHLFLLTPGRMPEWLTFYNCILITFIVIYFYFNYMAFHYSEDPSNNIKNAVNLLISRIH